MKRLALSLAVIAVGAAAQTTDPAARAFVARLVDAINRADTVSRRALMHPGALRCERALAESGWSPARGSIPAGYRWRVEPVPAGSKGLFADRFDYPVPPTHQLHIDYESAPNRSTGLLLQLVHEGGQWREVTGCPKAQTVEEARQAAPLRAQQEQRIAQVVARLAPGLRADVLKLVAEGRKIDAIVQMRQATGEDLAVAKGVVERLTEPGR
jgi:ribosomal protein L7/L12